MIRQVRRKWPAGSIDSSIPRTIPSDGPHVESSNGATKSGGRRANAGKKRFGSSYHRAHELADLTQRNIESIKDLEDAATAARTRLDRIASFVARVAGSTTFVALHVVWFAAWILWNTLPTVTEALRFDPYPFTFLTFVVSLEAIFLAAIILMSQNYEDRLTQRRSHLDPQIDLLSEQESSKMLAMLEAIHKRLGISSSDPEVSLLVESTCPETLVQQIEEIIESKEG